VIVNRDIILGFASCSNSEDIYDSDMENDKFKLIQNKINLQTRNLFYVKENPYEIEFTGNTFKNNAAVRGLIYVHSKERQAPVTIHSNTFSYNGAIAFTGLIHLRGTSSVPISSYAP